MTPNDILTNSPKFRKIFSAVFQLSQNVGDKEKCGQSIKLIEAEIDELMACKDLKEVEGSNLAKLKEYWDMLKEGYFGFSVVFCEEFSKYTKLLMGRGHVCVL